MNNKIQTLKQKITAGDADAYEYLTQITAECKTAEDKTLLTELAAELLASAEHTISKMERTVEEYTVKQQLGDLADVINFSYIARKYFGKSKHWLYQRLNGYTVNGRQATFSAEERKQFDAAMSDIRSKIQKFTIQTT